LRHPRTVGANEVYLANRRPENLARRLKLQHQAIANLKVLGYLVLEQGDTYALREQLLANLVLKRTSGGIP